MAGFTGTNGNDVMLGTAGDDNFFTTPGDDTFNGNGGIDTVWYASADSRVTVNLTTGTASGGVGSNVGTDSLINIENVIGSLQDDTITGNDGANVVNGRLGNDTIDGGAGTDTVTFDALFQDYKVDFNAATNVFTAVWFPQGLGVLDTDSVTNVELFAFRDVTKTADQLKGSQPIQPTLTGTPGDDTLVGTAGVDIIDGGAGNDAIDGLAGNDTLLGGAGNDSLNGGAGADRMEGGSGADVYIVEDLGDSVLEANNNDAGGGASAPSPAAVVDVRPPLDLGSTIDKVIASINYSLTAFVENLDAKAGAGNLSLTGNDLNNILLGNEGRNVLAGGAGTDLLDGQAGLDTATFTAARSTYTLSKNGGGFNVQASSGTDGTDTVVNVERLKFTNASVALDMAATQAGGQTALLLGAVLSQPALALKKPLLGVVIDLFDQGYTLQELSGAIMRLPIWGVLANGGAATASNTQIANYLLTTVNRSAPDAAALASATQLLDSETGATQGNFLWHLAESSANQLQVNLVGLAASGLDFGG